MGLLDVNEAIDPSSFFVILATVMTVVWSLESLEVKCKQPLLNMPCDVKFVWLLIVLWRNERAALYVGDKWTSSSFQEWVLYHFVNGLLVSSFKPSVLPIQNMYVILEWVSLLFPGVDKLQSLGLRSDPFCVESSCCLMMFCSPVYKSGIPQRIRLHVLECFSCV